jgi:Domain of unknown function (DUF4340)
MSLDRPNEVHPPMKDRGTYLLLVLFFAGLGGLWYADFSRVPTRSEIAQRSNRVLPSLIDTKPDDLQKVEILGGDQPLIFERRDGNRWQMTAPMDVAADPSKVETLAYNLKELSRRPDSATLEPDLSRYGLDHPERTIKLWGSATDAPLATLEIGRASLDRRYVRAGGSDGVEVVDARGLDLLRLPPVRWRDHELFRVPSFEVDAVNLSSGGRDLKLRRGRGAWHVVEPIRLLASDARVDGLIADLGSLRVLDDSRFFANDVKPADLDRYGLKTPALTIEVDSARVDRRRGSHVLHVGKSVEGKEGLIYAKRGDQDDVVIVDQRVLKDLRPEPNSFRSPKVADITPARVIRIGVEEGDGGTIEAARYGNDWAIVAPSTARGDRQAIQEFLKSLDQLQTGIYLNPRELADSGLDKPTLRLKVWHAPDRREPGASASSDQKGDLAMNLRIGHRDAARKVIYAQIEGDPTILALPDTANAFLPRNPLAFRDRQVLAVDVDPIEQIKFVGASRKVTLNAPVFKVGKQNMGLAPTNWWMVEPIQVLADAPSVGQLLRLLGNLRAESLVTEKPENLDKYGLKTPVLTVTWSATAGFSMVAKPSKTPGSIAMEDHSLLVGAPLPDKPSVRYAKLDDYPLIFTLGQDVLGTLDSEWRDHQVFAFDPTQVRKVHLGWPDRDLSLIAAAGTSARGWVLDLEQDAPDFDPASIGPLVLAASKLTTNRFAQYLGDFPRGVDLEPARLAIRFDLDDGSPPRLLKIGVPAGNGQVFATTEAGGKGPIFYLPEAPFAPLMKAPRHKGDLPDNVFAP